jgi:hypothetical protein
MRVNGGAVAVKNSIFAGNTSTSDGTAIYRNGGAVAILSCTFAGNSSSSSSPATVHGSDVFVANSIFVGNKGNHFSGSGVAAYGNLLDKAIPDGLGSPDAPNISCDENLPLFQDAENGDYTLAAGSQAAGSNTLKITVTAEDSITTKTYTVTVNRAYPEDVTGVSAVAGSLLRLYPNPVTNGELRIENGELKAGEKILVYSLPGSLVATYEVAAGAVTVINVSQLPQGVYVVKAGARAGKVVKN